MKTEISSSNKNHPAVWQRNMSETLVEIYYLIILRRISANYSVAEFAFLIGKTPAYVTNIETFKAKDIPVAELHLISRVLNSSLHTYFLYKPVPGERLTVEFSRTQRNCRIFHEANIVTGVSTRLLLFKLMEGDKKTDTRSCTLKSTTERINTLQATLTTLINEDYFQERKDAFTIYTRCRELVSSHFEPADLQEALRRIRTLRKMKDSGRFYYELR